MSPILFGVLVLVLRAGAQTPFCGEYLVCDPTNNNGYCCPTCVGIGSVSVIGSTTTCSCVSGCATQANSTSSATPPALWLQGVPTTRVSMTLLGASIGYYPTATLVTAAQIASPTSATSKNWPSNQWAFISVQLHDAGTGGPVGLPIMYQITPFTLTSSYTLQFPDDPSDSFTLTVTVMPSDCGQAGVQDATTCNQYCSFVNNAVPSLGASSGTFDGTGSCTCGSGSTAVVCAAPTTTTTTTTTTTSTTSALNNNNGGTPDTSSGSSSRLAAGAEAGIVIGIVAAIIVVVGVAIVLRRRSIARNKTAAVSWPASNA